MTSLLLLWSVASAAVGVLALVIAMRERMRGSRWWLLPGVCGMLLVVNSILRLVWWA